MILFGTFISHPYKKGADFSVIDLILALLAIPAGLFLTVQYPYIAVNMGPTVQPKLSMYIRLLGST